MHVLETFVPSYPEDEQISFLFDPRPLNEAPLPFTLFALTSPVVQRPRPEMRASYRLNFNLYGMPSWLCQEKRDSVSTRFDQGGVLS